MIRTLVTVVLLGLAASAVGCRMCAHPYDYCGPTFSGQCGETCNPMARAGSVLSPPLPVPGAAMNAPVVLSERDEATAPVEAAPTVAERPKDRQAQLPTGPVR
jgi:hypothetical protein